MKEHDPYQTALTAAEATYLLWELAVQQGVWKVDLDQQMRRLKDLSAYSFIHADICERVEMVELLALGMFFGATNDPRLRQNQWRSHYLSNETIDYQGQAEHIEQEIAARKQWISSSGYEEPDDSHHLCNIS